jgi:hypothetical protein
MSLFAVPWSNENRKRLNHTKPEFNTDPIPARELDLSLN